jgi:hypothetical protein
MAKRKKTKAVVRAPRNRAVPASALTRKVGKPTKAARKPVASPDGNTPVDAQPEIGERERLRPIDQA